MAFSDYSWGVMETGFKRESGPRRCRDSFGVRWSAVLCSFHYGSIAAALVCPPGVGSKTYKLYSISNLGSLLGLLSFPFLLEPALRMKTQSLIWSLLFFVFVVGCCLCAREALHACEEANSVAIFFAYAVGRWWPEISKLLEDVRFYPIAVLIGFLVVLGAFTFRSADNTTKRGFRFVQVLVLVVGGVAILALGRSTQPLPGLYLSARNFYGAIRVFNIPRGRMLMHGRTVHGGQFDPPVDKEPTTYYGRQSGIGAVMQNHPKRNAGDGTLRVGIIGLGAGSLAAYGRHGDYFRYLRN